MMVIRRPEKPLVASAPSGAALMYLLYLVGLIIVAVPSLTMRLHEEGVDVEMRMSATGVVTPESRSYSSSSGFSEASVDDLEDLGVGIAGRLALFLPLVGFVAWRFGTKGLLLSAAVSTVLVGWTVAAREIVERQVATLPPEIRHVVQIEDHWTFWLPIGVFAATGLLSAIGLTRRGTGRRQAPLS